MRGCCSQGTPTQTKHKALERGRRLPAAAYIQLFSHVDVCHSAEQYVTLAVQIMSVTLFVVICYLYRRVYSRHLPLPASDVTVSRIDTVESVKAKDLKENPGQKVISFLYRPTLSTV